MNPLTDGVRLLIFGLVGISCYVHSETLPSNTNDKISSALQLSDNRYKNTISVATTVSKVFKEPSISIPSDYKTITVTDAQGFKLAIQEANLNRGYTAIVLEPNTYPLNETINIKYPYIHISSSTGNPYDVIIRGPGMKSTPYSHKHF